MLRDVKGLHGSTIHALDGEIGRVDEILFDDEHWTVRYLIVDTGGWLSGRKVLISPIAFGFPDWEHQMLGVNLTREQIRNSPDVDTDKPVSRQWEMNYYGYYDWPYYWGGMGGWGAAWYPGLMLTQPIGYPESWQQKANARARDLQDHHLRSTKQVSGYGVAAMDGHIGHIDDFIVDDETWSIRYLAIDTRDWWPGKKVLLPPNWIGAVNWADNSVSVEVTREQVQNAPEWDPHQPISLAFEDQLYRFYAKQNPP